VIFLNGAIYLVLLTASKYFLKRAFLPANALLLATVCHWYMCMTHHAHSWGYMRMPYEFRQKGYGLPEGFVFGTNLSFARHQADLQCCIYRPVSGIATCYLETVI
jgi:hypothetical protein